MPLHFLLHPGGGGFAALEDGGFPERTVDAEQRRFVDVASREAAILALAAVAAVVFLNHEVFYLRAGFVPYAGPVWAYLLVTAVLYLFVRLMFIVAGMYFPGKRPEFVLCPECGHALDDASPHGREEHNRITLTPRPTEKEILSAIMLRKAIDDARRSAKRELAGPKPEAVRVPGDVENARLTFEEFERILQDIDVSAARRRGAPDRRPPRPPDRPG